MPRQDYAHLQRGPAGGFPTSGSPHHSTFELPPLAGFMGAGGVSGSGSGREFAGPQSSYMRSGSAAPSRTHSPLGPAGVVAGGTYVLPPPHGMSQYYPAGDIAGMLAMGMAGIIPNLADLERHYFELHEQRRKMEELLERTDRMIVGVKRGIDEMRGTSPPQPQQQQSPQQGGQPSQVQPPSQGMASTGNPAAVPLIRASGADRDRTRESVWPVVDSTKP